jgi:polyisoprenoid-binding protein YceI
MKLRYGLAAFLLCTGLVLPVASSQPAQPSQPTQPAARPPLTGVQRFEVRPGGSSRVSFTSEAPLETIDGVSVNTTGNLTVDLGDPSRQLSGSVAITTASLRTGSDLRDEHLRSANWLDAEHHPNITFALASTTVTGALRPGVAVRGQVRGRLTLHGVTREVALPVTVRLIPLSAEHADLAQFGVTSDMLRVQGTFNIQLSDYGVTIFRPLRLKVSNTIALRVDLTAFRAGS